MSDDNRMLAPDKQILSEIFPGVSGVFEYPVDIISNTFDVCTFRITLHFQLRHDFPSDLLIRLEKDEGKLHEVARLQRLCHIETPRMVPAILEVGVTHDEQGNEVMYSITPFVHGTTPLEDDWNDLHEDNQQSLMDSVVSAIRAFQGLRVQDDNVPQEHNIDGDSNAPYKRRFGGPEIGYHSSIRPLLESLLDPEAKDLSICQIAEDSGGLAIISTDENIGGVEFSLADLNELNDSIVLCHNDLEPRNILVRSNGTDGSGSPWYDIAAIIDWEMAGMFPFAYEFGIKDPYLGSNNLFYSWYRLFKEKTAVFVPAGAAQDKLIKALRVIFKSNDKAIPGNVGVNFRTRWLQRECLAMALETRSGWVRMEDAGEIPPLTKEEEEKLEDEVLKELGYI